MNGSDGDPQSDQNAQTETNDTAGGAAGDIAPTSGVGGRIPQAGGGRGVGVAETGGGTGGGVPQLGGQQVIFLTNKQLFGWGAGGGFLSVLATSGLFDIEKIDAMVRGTNPELQITTYIVFAVVISFAGAIWALAHKPISSIMVAIQLGLLAPAAINALIAAANLNAGTETRTNLNIINELFVSSAYASNHTSGPTKPSTIDCIIKALIKQSC